MNGLALYRPGPCLGLLLAKGSVDKTAQVNMRPVFSNAIKSLKH